MDTQASTLDRMAGALAVLRTRLPLVPDYEDELDELADRLAALVEATED